MRRRRGFILVLSLLLLLLLLMVGLGYLTKNSAQYRGASHAGPAAAARALAEAGMEDARVKLGKDLDFPPPGDSRSQVLFAYTEGMTDMDGTTPWGTYTVTIDSRYAAPPYSVIRVTSLGEYDVGQGLKARHQISGEIRVGSNPDSSHYINWVEDETVRLPPG